MPPRSAHGIDTLITLARREKDAGQKDRYRWAVHACKGVETAHIHIMLARSCGVVPRGVYAYRDGGIDALEEKVRQRHELRLPRQRQVELNARLDAGPTESDGVRTFRGKDCSASWSLSMV